jgi:cytochrome c-type biogenesis protein
MGQTTLKAPVAALPRLTTFIHAVLFVLGFSAVFVVVWGGAATALGQLLFDYQKYLTMIGGAVIILFGLAMLRVIRLPWLYYDTRPQWQGQGGGQGHLLSSVLMGVFFAAGWSPCIGTTLGAILTLGLSQDKAWQAMVLSSGYALGLGIPFLLIGLGVGRASDWVKRFRKHLRTIEIVNAIFMIAIGVLMLTQTLSYAMTRLAGWALDAGLFFDVPLGEGLPTYSIAVVAGVLSFLSPCVLPLVPAYIGYLSSRAMGAAPAAGVTD